MKTIFVCCDCGEECEEEIEDYFINDCGYVEDSAGCLVGDYEVEWRGSEEVGVATFENQVCEGCARAGGMEYEANGIQFYHCKTCEREFQKYWVKNNLWKEAFPEVKIREDGGIDSGGVLCIYCFQQCLGRKLKDSDYTVDLSTRGEF